MPEIQKKEEILESWLFDNCPHKSKKERRKNYVDLKFMAEPKP